MQREPEVIVQLTQADVDRLADPKDAMLSGKLPTKGRPRLFEIDQRHPLAKGLDVKGGL